ncbi:Ca-activated chloride channel-like protein [Desulfosarcina sp. BuS5]|uniref:VIT domain-containing protein n=1 Tax=Desulfosarcina sp. BuS5 TaxID=933262 RepID=UPI0004866741|nr:VIT domain-containing protein [Desulfosarcina sp. BuS5]WDN89176.1 Ca-activated chloride channel-like protein [Desulfosarcina sp. BuS5]
MGKIKTIALILFFALPGIITAHPAAMAAEEADKTLSPYFFVNTDEPGIDRLPLKSTSVDVNISGVIADVKVTQVYKNEGRRPIEAVYVFPASTRVAVYGMKMTIGERTIVARISERDEARRKYEAAKKSGRSASLLEQQRPNVFQMNVANILPSDIIKVELRYTELLIPVDRIYEFVYPTVVGPRYSDKRAGEMSPSEQWVENPYLREGEAPAELFNIDLTLNAGLPIDEIVCNSHKVDIGYNGLNSASINLSATEKHASNRDFILKYRLAGGKIESGMLLYEGEKENFFLVMLQPPKKVQASLIPPREYIFIVDVSGSMHGFPLDISKKLLKDLISGLRAEDRFNLLLFAGGSSVMSEKSLPATQDNIRKAIDIIERQRGGGGTNLLPALKKGLAMPGTEGSSRSIIIATDGYVTVKEEAFDLIRNSLGDANFFSFGIGSSVNRHLIEGMARVGMGQPFIITRPEEAAEKAEKFRNMIMTPVLTNIKIDFGKFKVFDVEPPCITDLLTDRPVIIFGKYRGKPKGIIKLKGVTGEGLFNRNIALSGIKPIKAGAALRYLWARHRIALLADYNLLRPNDERIKEVTSLGLSYNLLTAYTSFLAVDSHKRLKNGKATIVKQPLPLPRGVSNYAVGKMNFSNKMFSAQPAIPSSGGFLVRQKAVGRKEAKGDLSVESELVSDSEDMNDIRIKNVAVTGKLVKQAALKVLEKGILKINLCYNKFSKKRSGAYKETIVILSVDSSGRVTRVRTESKDLGNSRLEGCIINNLEGLLFPPVKGGCRIKLTVIFPV